MYTPLLSTVVSILKIIKQFQGIVFLSNGYLLSFLICIIMVLYMDGVAVAQQAMPYIPWHLSYANLLNFASILLAWAFSLHQALLAADYRLGKNMLIITKETIIALILGILIFVIAYLDWDKYSINAYITIIVMAFLVAQTAISRMVIMTKAHARNIQRIKHHI
jgi:hypothetical protein